MLKLNSLRLGAAAVLVLAASAAQAHPGHGAAGFTDALRHPFTGLDHLLAMVAVGAWSVAALPAGRRLAGPAVFLVMLLAGVALAWSGVMLPGVEAGVAISVTLFGIMLLAGRRLPTVPGLLMVGAAALLHGSAHGSELVPGADMLVTASGIALASAALHAVGLMAGIRLQAMASWATQLAALLLGSSGLVMLATRL
ncbi:HupE/UreJ family protein [soil metagenome]